MHTYIYSLVNIKRFFFFLNCDGSWRLSHCDFDRNWPEMSRQQTGLVTQTRSNLSQGDRISIKKTSGCIIHETKVALLCMQRLVFSRHFRYCFLLSDQRREKIVTKRKKKTFERVKKATFQYNYVYSPLNFCFFGSSTR